jgi:hypothetical protein
LAEPRRIDVNAPAPAEERRAKGRSPSSANSPANLSTVQGEPGQSCAYNQTRECVLGLQVVVGDFSLASLRDWMATLTPNSAAGIWMVPFRGILATDAGVPLDLLYLDADNRVLDAVEFFPTFRVSTSSPTAASVLALPSHSIFASQTQRGDRLMLCSAEEMKWRLEQLPPAGTAAADGADQQASFVPGPMLVREEPKRAAGPALAREELGMAAVSVPLESPIAPVPQVPIEQPAAKPEGKSAKSPRGWLDRWLHPEPPNPRKAAREPLDGLAAYFFTGGAPEPHEIRDVSSTGLFVVTTERWYPGTLIRMTLSKPDIGQAPSERSITINARSVRWGNDGVGLEFVVEPRDRSNRGPASPIDAVDSKRLGHFLKHLEKSKR